MGQESGSFRSLCRIWFFGRSVRNLAGYDLRLFQASVLALQGFELRMLRSRVVCYGEGF